MNLLTSSWRLYLILFSHLLVLRLKRPTSLRIEDLQPMIGFLSKMLCLFPLFFFQPNINSYPFSTSQLTCHFLMRIFSLCLSDQKELLYKLSFQFSFVFHNLLHALLSFITFITCAHLFDVELRMLDCKLHADGGHLRSSSLMCSVCPTQ